jgi:hypothetical protein
MKKHADVATFVAFSERIEVFISMLFCDGKWRPVVPD